MQRSAEKYLTNWINKTSRKPLVLRGARQVGKSTLVRNFAKRTGMRLNEINLERHLYLDDIFKSTDTERICRELEALLGRNVKDKGSILFLDEIQATPNALMALRYFFEDLPEIPIITAGSLLEFTLADHSFSMPVGRIEYFHLYPMSFSEFIAVLEPALLSYLGKIKPDDPIPGIAHHKLLEHQRQYFFVGGMPEAVNVFNKTGSLTEVSAVHRSIVNTYLDDFSKYAKRQDLSLMQKVFSAIPRLLGKKVKYSNIDRDKRAAKIKEAIDYLSKARVCQRIIHCHCSGLPLQADINENIYKLLFLDIGLANHVCGLDWLAISSLGEQGLVNEGGLAEQFIGQHLINISKGLLPPQLNYWLREGKSVNAEIDYIVASGDWIVPIEVKAGKSGTLKSLFYFVALGKAKIAIRFDLNQASRQQVSHAIPTSQGNKKISFPLISLPLYAVETLPQIIDNERRNILDPAIS